MQVSRYIHRNPVEAGMVAEPWQWPWSSAPAYLGLTRTPAWLHTGAILDMLGPHDARQSYRELLAEDSAIQAADGEVVPWGQTRRV
jgi:putative transposase